MIINYNDMKPLNKNKKYDLSQLNDEQLQAVLDWLKENDKFWDNRSIDVFKPSYKSHPLTFHITDFKLFGDIDDLCVNALELFEEELKKYQITEYATGDFGDLGTKNGVIKAKDKEHAWLLYKETHRLKDSEKGFYSFVEVSEELPLKGSVTVKTEMPKNIDFKKELPNITFTQNESVYDDMLSLIEKGKQHGLKIVVTFERL